MAKIGKPSEGNGVILYISHGGGPLPLLGDKSHEKMVQFMKELPTKIPKPSAIIVISAHWEEKNATVLSGPNPKLLYDYFGFPKASYEITYPASGHRELSERISGLLKKHEIPCHSDEKRGFDQGLFIPLMLMYPNADIPALQLSLVKGLDPTTHLNVGRALQSMLEDDILVIGSGFSFHNMRAFVSDGSEPADTANDEFQEWLIETCTKPMSIDERSQRLTQWAAAPSARYCHPREEHLLPLHVCAGIAGLSPASKLFDDYIIGKRSVAFQW